MTRDGVDSNMKQESEGFFKQNRDFVDAIVIIVKVFSVLFKARHVLTASLGRNTRRCSEGCHCGIDQPNN